MSASTIDADAAVKKPRTKPAEIRREELMDAARDLFLEKGFAATSVDEIVRVADVAKGTFYIYFKTKDEVLEALKVRFIETFCRRVEEAVEKRAADDWPGRLDAWKKLQAERAYLQKQKNDPAARRERKAGVSWERVRSKKKRS